MEPTLSRRGNFLLPRFVATLSIAGQLVWGLPPLAADTLRPSVEGTQAGLEEILQPAGMEEDLGEMLKAQTLSLLNKVLGGPEITAITADHLRRLQNLFQAASPEQKRLFLRDLVRIYGPSLERLAQGRVREATKLSPAAEDTDPPIVVAGPAVNLNLNIGWKSSETSPGTLEIDLAGTSLKADGSPTNVMEALQQLGQAYRSIGVRSGGERPIGRIFFDLLRAAGIPATGWPAASPDIDFAPTMAAGALGLDLRFLPPEPRWEPSELEAYAQAVHRAIEGLGQANRRTALLWTSRVPANAPPGFLSDLFGAGRERGIFVVYDPKVTTLNDPVILQALLQAGPHLIAPNLEEFSALARRPVARTPAEIVRAARELLAKSDLQMILISLAGEGALLVDQARVAYANVEPEVAVLGPGGAGDVGLANLLHLYTQAEKIWGSFSELTDEDFVALLRAYVAGGAAAVQMPGDETPTRALVGEMERGVHTKLFKNPSQEQLSRFGGFEQLRARADAPYRDQVWVPRLERFFYSHPAVPSADNAGSDLYLNFILSRPERFRGKEVLDPVTGSGVLAAALALAGAGRVVATDISPETARLAEANLNGIPEIRGRVTVGVSDAYDNLPNITDVRQFDVVVANSPTGRWNPVPGQSRTHEASAGEGFEVPRKLLDGLSRWTKASGEGAYMTTRGVPEEDPPRRLTAQYLGRLLAPGWAVEPTGYEAMGRSEKVPLMIQHVHRIETAGMEETWPSVLVVRPVLRFPTLAPDPQVEPLLTLPFSREVYRAALDWLGRHEYRMPRSAQLFDHLLGSNHSKTPSGKMRMDRTQLVVPFQQVERQTQGSRLPIFELPPEVRSSVVDFLGIYLLTLQLPPERAQELPIPARWSLRRFHVTAHRARNQLPHLQDDPRWGAFLDRIGQIPRSTRRILAGEPAIVVQADEISAEGRGAVEQMAGNLPADATDDLRTFLASYMDRRLRLERDRLQEAEIPIPPGWDLGRAARVVERWRPALERIAASDEVLRLTLRQMDRLVGSQPEPSLSDTQRKTVRAYLRLITHTSRGIQLPTPEQIAEERGDVNPTTAASHLREIRGQFQGRARAEVYLPVASRREFSRMLEESVQAYNRDHRPEVRITVSPGQLYQIYVVFQRLSGAERRRPVSLADLGREAGKISPQEARVRLEALDRLFRYLGIRLTETWDSNSQTVRLAEPPGPEPPPPPSAEEIVSRRLQEILRGERLDSAADWPVLLDLAREQLVQEGLLGETASLPEATVQALYQQIVNPGGSSAGMEETGQVEWRQPLPAAEAYERIHAFLEAIGRGKKEGYQRGAIVDLRNLPPGKRVLFVGDMHGYGGVLERVLHREDLEDENTLLILSGDAVHREDPKDWGEMDTSVGLMQRIMELKIRSPGRVYYVLGNHDKPSLSIRRGGGRGSFAIGEAYFRRMEELYPRRSDQEKSYADLYREFLQGSPILVIGEGWLFVHQGPILGATLQEVEKADVASLVSDPAKMDPIVKQAVDGNDYNGGSVLEFLRNMGLPEGARIITSHFHRPTDWWHKRLLVGIGVPEVADTVHNIYAGYRSTIGRWGYARYRDGALEIVKFLGEESLDVERYPTPRAGMEQPEEPMLPPREIDYDSEWNLNRRYRALDRWYGGALNQTIQELLPQEGEPPLPVLFVGVGRGNEALGAKRRFGDRIDVWAINKKKGELYDTEHFLKEAPIASDEDRERELGLFRSVQRNLRIVDLEDETTSLDQLFSGQKFTVVVFGNSVSFYMQDKVRVFNRVLRELVRPNGHLFVSTSNIAVDGFSSDRFFRDLSRDNRGVVEEVGTHRLRLRNDGNFQIPLSFHQAEWIQGGGSRSDYDSMPGAGMEEHLAASEAILQSINQHGILAPAEMQQRGINVHGSFDYVNPGMRITEAAGVNLVRAGGADWNQQTAWQVVQSEASGVQTVLLERRSDWERGMPHLPQRDLAEVLAQRAQFGAVCLIDAAKVHERDHELFGIFRFEAGKMIELRARRPIPMEAVDRVLVSDAVAEISRKVFPDEKIIVVPNRNMEVKAVRTNPKGGVALTRKAQVEAPDFERGMEDYLNSLQPGRRVAVHAVRLMAPSDLTQTLERTDAESVALAKLWAKAKEAAPEMKWVILGPSIAERFDLLEYLGFLEQERILIDRNPIETIGRLDVLGADVAYYYGTEKEAAQIKDLVESPNPLGSAAIIPHLPEGATFADHLRQILVLLNVPTDVIAAGLEEFTSGQEAMDVAA